MCHSFFQKLMNVQWAHTIVSNVVLTLMAPSPVHVTVVTDCLAIEEVAMVCSLLI